jgi:hypothetical protein
MSRTCPAVLIAASLVIGCRDTAADQARQRAAAERVALDMTGRAWNHSVAVDSFLTRGDTAIVWVSPSDWMATDEPNAGVHVVPGARIVRIQWIYGG